MTKKALYLILPIFTGLVLLMGTFQFVSAHSYDVKVDVDKEGMHFFSESDGQAILSVPLLG